MVKRGRPLKEEAKRERFQLRMSAEEEEMLEFVCAKTGETKTEVFRRMLRSAYNLAKYAD